MLWQVLGCYTFTMFSSTVMISLSLLATPVNLWEKFCTASSQVEGSWLDQHSTAKRSRLKTLEFMRGSESLIALIKVLTVSAQSPGNGTPMSCKTCFIVCLRDKCLSLFPSPFLVEKQIQVRPRVWARQKSAVLY